MNRIKKILMNLSFVLFMLVSNSVGISPFTNVAKAADDGEQTVILDDQDQNEENEDGGSAEVAEAEAEQPTIAAEGTEGEDAEVPEEKVAVEKKEAVQENPAAADELNAPVLLAADPQGEDGEITIRAEGDGVDVYDPSTIIIPFEKSGTMKTSHCVRNRSQ